MLREKFKWRPHENESTDAKHRGGVARSSEESPVMGLERRGYIVRLYFLVNQKWEEPVSKARASRAQWMICRGESQVCYTETIYHTVPSLVDDLTPGIHKAYVNLRAGVLCRDFVAQRCYEETI